MNITIKKTDSTFFSDTARDNGVEDYHYFDIIADGVKVGSTEVVDGFNEDNDIAYIDRIDIDEAYRGKGIGSTVLTECLKDEGYYNVVVAPDNEDAKRLYERLGEECSTIYGCDCDFSYNDQGYGVYAI